MRISLLWTSAAVLARAEASDHRQLQETLADSVPGDNPGGVKNLIKENAGLTGSIPTEIGLLVNAEVLEFSGNDLTGTIPTQIGLCTSLKILNWRQNSLTGPIPSEIGLLTNLMQVGLDDNSLTGELPPEVANLKSVRTFKVGGTNQITGGTLPFAALESTSFYVDWIASFLEMTGTLPTEIGLCSTLQRLELFVQQMKGTLPTQLGQLTQLQSLQLEFNFFEGKIPSQFGLMTSMTRLSLHDNKLVGAIPPTIGNAMALQSLTLDLNDLTGPVPSQVGLLSNLQTLNLNENKGLTGPIPVELAPLATLGKFREMNITMTGLQGSIPQDVCLITFECQEECYLDYDCQPEGGLCGCSGCNCPIAVLEPGTSYGNDGRFENEGGSGPESSDTSTGFTMWATTATPVVLISNYFL